MTDLSGIHTLPELFCWRADLSPDGAAYAQFDPHAGKWQRLTWREIAEVVGRWTCALQALDLARGSRVAILLPNGTAAVCADQGAMAAGLAPVPLHVIDNPGSMAYILADSGASVLVLRTRREWNAIAAAGESLPDLRCVVVVDDEAVAAPAGNQAPRVVSAQQWLLESVGAERPAEIAPDDLASIVYTSGTTGRPKGVMLTQRNVVANVKAVMAHVEVREDDVFLSFLPLSHTFERTAGYYVPIAAGSCVAYVRSIAQIADDLKTVRPTVLISVPRIYERFFSKIEETLARGNALTRGLFAAAQAVGWRRFCRAQSIPQEGSSPWTDALVWPVLDVLVAKKVLAQFGGRVRVAVSGGAPLSAAVARCFLGLGFPLLQGYGMTETSPVVAANTLGDNWPDTVGRALQGVEVRIGENAELQVRGENVTKGYWKRPEDTQKLMTGDGWLRTGDQAAVEGGRIRILGRIKEIIVTSTGEKIAPADLELAITADPLFEQAWVIGEAKPFLSVFVVLNPGQWKHSGGGAPDDEAGRKALLQRIEAATRRFPRYAVPRAVRSTLEPWTVQNSLMTPTLKLKRNNLQNHYQAEIDAIYRDRGKSA